MTLHVASANLAGGVGNVPTMNRSSGPDLYDFLVESELEHYFAQLKGDLKVATVAHLKYVEDDDLTNLGMSKPEMRRLKKFYHKYYPQNYLLRIKKKLISKGDLVGLRTSTLQSVEPAAPVSAPSSVSSSSASSDKQSARVPSKHIISADNISINKELGVGEFGVVQQGVWTNEDGHRIQVAIKRLSKERLQNNSMDFLKEASIMHAIYNEHIVRLYGVVLETNTLMLVTELAPLRSLLECLKEPALRPSFPVMTLCEFAMQICDGMQYLENKRLIHRDLAARNILVFSKNKVKISDFGLSRALGVGKDYYQTNFNVNLKLPIAWCAPECINYLRFTSASDVWAFGVTLWELFSYGFQPWAALTGQQILEAIDEPQFQRLEQPECCPREYYALMIRCWQPLPDRRPKFTEIWSLLPDCKPEQVQAVKDSEEPTAAAGNACAVNGTTRAVSITRREMLPYKSGEVIAVLDNKPQMDNVLVWKGVLNSGKTGLFYPANTVAYLGTEMPSMKPSFLRPDGKAGGVYSSRRRLRPDMISGPQDDLKHTGHVGLDGAFFGDITFLGDKYGQLPKQVVTPYKPQDDRSLMRAQPDASDLAPLIGAESRSGSTSDSNWPPDAESRDRTNATSSDVTASDKIEGGGGGGRPSACCGATSTSTRHPSEAPLTEHEYHEISDDEYELDGTNGKVDENYFQNRLDFGPSLMDEVFTALNCRPDGTDSGPPDSPSSAAAAIAVERDEKTNNTRNEIREFVAKATASSGSSQETTGSSGGVFSSLKRVGKKHHQTVKPISNSDAKAIESAIAIANELASRNMLDMDGGINGGFNGGGSKSESDSPRTPSSPSKRKFSFKFGGASKSNGNGGASSPRSEKRNFSREAASIPDIQASLTEEAKEAYNSLVEKRHFESATSLVADENPSENGGPAAAAVVGTAVTDDEPQQKHVETNPLRILRSGVPVRPKIRGNKHSFGTGSSRSNGVQPQSLSAVQLHQVDNTGSSKSSSLGGITSRIGLESGSAVADQSPGVTSNSNNLLPLPPRDRSKPMPTHKPRQRKHPLIIPATGGSRTLVKPSLCNSMSDVNPSSPTSSSSCTSISDLNSPISPSELPSSAMFPSSDSQTSLTTERLHGTDPTALAPAKPPRLHSLDDSFDGQIQADMDSLDDIPEEEAPVPPMYRNSDHVSCEDLMDFALDLPNSKRTQGRARGIDSDEVRIMQKVLANEVGSKECVEALNETDWDVHKAIKYMKLRLLLLTNRLVGNASVNNSCKQTLMSCGWDVQKAYGYLTATYGVTEDSTDV